SEVDVNPYVDAIERNANNAWQCANDLAYLLQTDQKLRADGTKAARLSKIIIARIKSGPPRGEDEKQVAQEVGLHGFLCKALGEFATPEALPGLLEAARPQEAGGSDTATDPKVAKATREGQFEVRKAAIEGLALLTHHLAQAGEPTADPEMT